MAGIEVEKKDERGTSKSCSCCEQERGANQVERGLYVCESCGTVANADVNGAENIGRKLKQVPPNPANDRSNGWLAQPSVSQFDRESGSFTTKGLTLS